MSNNQQLHTSAESTDPRIVHLDNCHSDGCETCRDVLRQLAEEAARRNATWTIQQLPDGDWAAIRETGQIQFLGTSPKEVCSYIVDYYD